MRPGHIDYHLLVATVMLLIVGLLAVYTSSFAVGYSEPDAGLFDGALFLLCHETNPEVALLIEAVKEEGNAKFRYALARLGHAELHVAFDEKEVWRQERIADTKLQDAYWLLYRGVDP